MVNYENGKIYKLLLPDGYYYIGCTCNELKVRKQQHKKAFNHTKREKTKLYLYIKQKGFEWNDIKMVEIQKIEAKTRSELLLLESQTIRQYYTDSFCLNTFVFSRQDGTTQRNRLDNEKQKRQNNLEEVRENDKQRYYNKKRERMLEKVKCECGVETCRVTLNKHMKTKKHLKWIDENKLS